ncbi:MAG: transposase [Candidatus Aminicenantales bacterium]
MLSEEFRANAVFFQLQLLASTLVEVFKDVHLARSRWRRRINQLRYRLIHIDGVVARHARRTVLRLSVHYRSAET